MKKNKETHRGSCRCAFYIAVFVWKLGKLPKGFRSRCGKNGTLRRDRDCRTV